MRSTVTIRDVAKAAGVSKTTTVFVLNDKPGFNIPEATRNRVRDAAAKLGYRRNGVASALSCGRIHTVGVVVPFTFPEHSSAFSLIYAKDVLIAISDAARRVGLRITLVQQDEGAALSADELTDGRVDGLILVSVRDDSVSKAVYETGFPCVTIGSGYARLPVSIDERGGIGAAVDHLATLGHRRIAYGVNNNASTVDHERAEGFRDAVARHGLNPARCPVLSTPEAVTALLSAPTGERPTAFVAFNDHQGFKVVREARRLGLRVPEDLSVVGFDNNILAEACFPPLTTIQNPLEQIATEAISLLQRLWNGEEIAVPAPLPTHLIVRESTAPVLEEIQ